MSKWGRRGLSVRNRSSTCHWKSAVSSDARSLMPSGLNYSVLLFSGHLSSWEWPQYNTLTGSWCLGTDWESCVTPLSQGAVLFLLLELQLEGALHLAVYYSVGLLQALLSSDHELRTDSLNCKHTVLDTLRWNLLSLLHNNPTVVWDIDTEFTQAFVSPGKTSLVLSFIPHRPPF